MRFFKTELFRFEINQDAWNKNRDVSQGKYKSEGVELININKISSIARLDQPYVQIYLYNSYLYIKQEDYKRLLKVLK